MSVAGRQGSTYSGICGSRGRDSSSQCGRKRQSAVRHAMHSNTHTQAWAHARACTQHACALHDVGYIPLLLQPSPLPARSRSRARSASHPLSFHLPVAQASSPARPLVVLPGSSCRGPHPGSHTTGAMRRPVTAQTLNPAIFVLFKQCLC